jgi:hypothetical protein
VQAGSVVQIELAYVGRPPGYPSSVAPVAYTIETSLVTGDQQQRGDLRAIVFGDTTRTQMLADARLEVIDGPAAGQVAIFEPASDSIGSTTWPPASFASVRPRRGSSRWNKRLRWALSCRVKWCSLVQCRWRTALIN